MVTEAASGIVASYAAAWGAHDEGERGALVERFWGRMLDPQGTVAFEGMDFGELSDDGGRLKRIVGFFGPLPPG
jgi:hypothetical protein